MSVEAANAFISGWPKTMAERVKPVSLVINSHKEAISGLGKPIDDKGPTEVVKE